MLVNGQSFGGLRLAACLGACPAAGGQQQRRVERKGESRGILRISPSMGWAKSLMETKMWTLELSLSLSLHGESAFVVAPGSCAAGSFHSFLDIAMSL